MDAGIDGIGLSVPSTYLDLADLAEARGIPKDKYTQGLGTLRMSVPEPTDDTVSMAARAGKAALDATGVSPQDVGMCVVGTETAVDHSKPVASFVQGILGLPKTCRIFETKHACYGGTAGLQAALDWIRAGSAEGKKALVICSDIARYGFKTPGEPTQGAGAVALLVSASPRILSVDAGLVGTCSTDVHDFFRPLDAQEAIVDGHYSVSCYLSALEGAYREYQRRAGPSEGYFSDRFRCIAYHVPYGKMARKAHAQLRQLDGDSSPEKSFERQVAGSLALPSQVGNIYTGSLYLSLASALLEEKEELAGQRVGLFSYGSGCCAEFFSGKVQPTARALLHRAELLQQVERRRKISVAEYETMMRQRDSKAELSTSPVPESGIHYLGTKNFQRTYSK
jgi:hydroxymethylglutaryl-CoA synthase